VCTNWRGRRTYSIDINEGIKPQTAEVIQILKKNQTPFVIAINKIDNISGWRDYSKEGLGLKESIKRQKENVKQVFNERYMTLIGSLNSYGFDADLFYNIDDFTKRIALVPTSAETKEGIQELIMMLCGLSQKYLTKRLTLGKEPKGVMLEVKKEKSQNYIEAILYDGELKATDEIAVSNFEGEPIVSKIRILEEIQPLCNKFKRTESVTAATGLKIQLVDKSPILAGMPFVKFNNNLEEIKTMFQKEINENIKTKKQGIIAKADSLGSLEALLVLLEQNNIPVVKAGIGPINKSDVISGKANLDINELDAIIIGFNVEMDEDAKEILPKNVKVLTDDVVYKLIENIVKYREEKRKEIEKKRLLELAKITKLKILHQYVFRNTNPAIFGVKVEGGKLSSGQKLMDEEGDDVARVKNIQENKDSVEEALEGKEVAMSLPGINYERAMKEKNYLYSIISENQFRKFKKNKDLLSSKEMEVLREIAEIKRKKEPEWGM
jgi:translation initiation factor 5B